MHEKTLKTKSIYSGRIVHLELVDVELPDGTQAVREVIRHAGAAVILPQRSDGRFLFVEQFRKPVDQVLLEAPAGTREDDEDAEVCARREVLEETGHTATRVVHLGTVYPSPGYVEERMEFFYAEVEDGSSALALDHDELLQPVALTREEFCDRLMRGEVTDAKTLALWLLYEKKAEELSLYPSKS